MYKTLSAWRGVFVIIIVLVHSPFMFLNEPAHMGVTYCFVMSAALLAMRHTRIEGSWWQWFKPRAGHIYRVHWVVLVLLLALALPIGRLTIEPSLAANALLVQTWFPWRDWFLSYNKPTWFLATLVACYAMFPVYIKLFSRLSLKAVWAIALALMVTHISIMSAVSQPMRDWLTVFPPMRQAEWVWGIALGLSMGRIEHATGPWVRRHATAVELGVVAVALASITIVKNVPWFYRCEDVTAWWLPVSLLLATGMMLNGHEGLVGKLMLTRPMQWLGKMSLEIYMIAPLVTTFYIRYVSPVFGHFGMVEAYSMGRIVTLPLTLIAAVGLYWLFKKLKLR